MAAVVIVKFRSFLPGGGHDRSGGQRQGKTNVRGRIEVTSVGTGGQALPASSLSLTKIDDLTLTLEEPVRDADPTSDRRAVGYSHSSEEFYVWGVAGITGVTTALANGSTYNMTFDAFGDSAHDVELL